MNFTHKRGVPWNFQCMIFHPLDNTSPEERQMYVCFGQRDVYCVIRYLTGSICNTGITLSTVTAEPSNWVFPEVTGF